MELALYCPVHGYYETKADNPGRQGDFYTSVGVGGLFGQLLAFQFAEWLEPLRVAECGLQIVEAGAHDGKLAGDILDWLKLNRPGLLERIEYRIIEPSAQRQAWQKATLNNLAPHVRWHSSFQSIRSGDPKSEIRNPKLNGIIFANELLDAMPVRRFGWDAANKVWFEWGVGLAGGKFVWVKIPNSSAGITKPELDLPEQLLMALPDGYLIETCPAAQAWWREAAAILGQGRLMTIDYGLSAEELFSPGRLRGTLRAYFRQHVSDDLLANVGEQDLTAHVNFSAIQGVGESAGLKTRSFSTQSQFLTHILGNAAKDKSFSGWNTSQTRQFQTLTHPDHLGHAFRVLVQSR